MTQPSGQPRQRSARKVFASSILISEVIVIFFAGLVAVRLDLAPATETWLVTGVLMSVAVIAAGTLRSSLGYGIGSVLQGAVLVSGLVVSVMWFLGAVFLALWVMAMLVGGTIDRERAAAEA